MTALAFGGIYGWTTSWVIAGFVAFVVAAPAFLWVESHRPDPLLDLGLFRNRLFALGNLTGLLNGIARNGVLFLLVFYLQGARGYDPITAGLMLPRWRSGCSCCRRSAARSPTGSARASWRRSGCSSPPSACSG